MNVLKDPVGKVRRNAATSLGAFQPESAQIIPALLERLSDEDVEVRRASIVSLGMLGKGSAPAEQAVTAYINDPDPAIRMDAVVAAAAMGRRDDAVIPMLVDALAATEEATVKAARKALTDIGIDSPQKVLPLLLEVLIKQGDPRVVNAVRVVGNLKDRAAESAPLLAGAYDNVEVSKRHHVVDALLTVDQTGKHAIPILVKSLDAIDPLDRRESLLGLMRYRSDVTAILPPLTRAFNDPSQENRLLAVSIVRGLGEKAQGAVPALIPAAKDPDVKMRKAAVGALGSIGASGPEVLELLEQTLQDKEVGVRLTSVYSLRRVMTATSQDEAREQVEKLLQTALEKDTDANMQKALRSALVTCTRKQSGNQHSKLDESGKPVKPGQGLPESQPGSQYK